MRARTSVAQPPVELVESANSGGPTSGRREASDEVRDLVQAHDGAFEALFGAPPPAHRVGRYELRRELGHGGADVVYLALDTDLERCVALKLLDSSRAPDEATRVGVARMLREAKALARLSHPNVVEVYEVTTDPELCIAMEYVDGTTLREFASANHDWRVTLRKYVDAGTGLAAVHRIGLVHRDFKPENVLVSHDGVVKVADFGIVLVDPRADAPAPRKASSAAPGGHPVGTPAYMAPEQRMGERVDARADQFSYCVALYEALVGQHPAAVVEDLAGKPRAPFAGVDRSRRRAQFRRFARTAHRVLPRWLVRVLLIGLASDPQCRWRDMDALLAEVHRRLDPKPRLGPRRIATGLVVAGAVAALAKDAVVPPTPVVCEATSLSDIWNEATSAAIGQRFALSARTHARR